MKNAYTYDEILALRKCAAAERFTTVSGRVGHMGVYVSLETQGLIEWRKGWRLSDAGKRALEDIAANQKAVRP